MSSSLHAAPVIILGAARSGTNMLRDVLCSLPGFGTWPCDEINYIWRHGNVCHPSDEFTPEQATAPIQRYIRRQFDWVARRYNAHTVVEKTCANSLRVGFVDQIVREAQYIFIRRNGLDAVGSALKRWTAKLDLVYILRKARFVPPTDLPFYAGRYLGNRLYRLVSREQRLAFWGPKLNGMKELLTRYSLEEVCALQWKRCVDAVTEAFSEMPNDRWVEVGYEDFVRNPEEELSKVIGFLGLKVANELRRQAVAKVTPANIGKGRTALGEKTVKRLMPLIQDTMARYGYM